jgi:hypothetical protein
MDMPWPQLDAWKTLMCMSMSLHVTHVFNQSSTSLNPGKNRVLDILLPLRIMSVLSSYKEASSIDKEEWAHAVTVHHQASSRGQRASQVHPSLRSYARSLAVKHPRRKLWHQGNLLDINLGSLAHCIRWARQRRPPASRTARARTRTCPWLHRPPKPRHWCTRASPWRHEPSSTRARARLPWKTPSRARHCREHQVPVAPI